MKVMMSPSLSPAFNARLSGENSFIVTTAVCFLDDNSQSRGKRRVDWPWKKHIRADVPAEAADYKRDIVSAGKPVNPVGYAGTIHDMISPGEHDHLGIGLFLQ